MKTVRLTGQTCTFEGLIPRALFLGEIFRLFLLNCDYSNKLFLLECSQFKRNRRNISHFAEKKRSWNQALTFQFSKQHFAGRDLQTTFEYLILFISDLASVYTQNQQMDNFKTNKFGRSYISGKPLSEDFRVLILDTIIEKGGDSLLTGYIPVTLIYRDCETFLRFAANSCKDMREFCQRNSFAVQSRGGLRINNRKLTDNDLELIETLSLALRSIPYLLSTFRSVPNHCQLICDY